METYETIGTAVRQLDAIRLNVLKGEPTTYYIAAASVAQLFDGATVPLHRLQLAGDYVMPVDVVEASAHISSTGRSVLLWLGRDCLQIPTRQLQVHYERGLGETSKIIRRIEAEAPAAASSCAPAALVAVV